MLTRVDTLRRVHSVGFSRGKAQVMSKNVGDRITTYALMSEDKLNGSSVNLPRKRRDVTEMLVNA